MAERITFTSIVNTLHSYLGLFMLLGGGLVISPILAAAAWATKALQPYAPLSWTIAALLGLLLFAAVVWLIAKAREYWILATITRSYNITKDIIDPMQTTFQTKRININDMILPFHRIINNKIFIDCDIFGPANIILQASSPTQGQITQCEFNASKAVEIKNQGPVPPFAIILRDCTLIRCRIFGLIFFIQQSHRAHMEKEKPGEMPEDFWITPRSPGHVPDVDMAHVPGAALPDVSEP